jgi:hypothetical protein
MKEKGPIRHGKSHLKEDFQSDEKRHDPWKHVENHLKNLLKEVMGEAWSWRTHLLLLSQLCPVSSTSFHHYRPGLASERTLAP